MFSWIKIVNQVFMFSGTILCTILLFKAQIILLHNLSVSGARRLVKQEYLVKFWNNFTHLFR